LVALSFLRCQVFLLGSMYKQDVQARIQVASNVYCSVPQSVTAVYVYIVLAM